jgi:hypothetical protein
MRMNSSQVRHFGRIFAASCWQSASNLFRKAALMRAAMLSLAISASLVSPILAQETPRAPAARYSMTTVEGGVMRLDGQTGRMSFCTKTGETYACKAIEDDRAGFMDEIEAMAKQNAELKKQIADGGASLRLPKEEDLDRAFTLMDRMIRRFADPSAPEPKPQSDRF